ncbi:hypothetical protein F441_04561 [Phytophthora nicotianae CJ01A1]|uniref:BZIP domain-containing protein n=4 Tax=Phytophthora nicotianae TaxID=4792 RepID=W2QIZ3_PHYN3|nr:hypothetical protein PPTG_08879 [Phytophthora nicotianae INRA-310]ETK92098.1 hypothetical protein L915_04459 [Phytophthora nicotianae]ETO80982.1 hypothetical protein F444_04616 [Phytophthora nicotianae P1976]ETP22036.1 hypothetical protein F441_04561 [Phytophthora nicotianae CJ01A1]KUF81913.1 hypothetical protein AM587_10006168 [Phytophthora nicotianae]ETL45478.1 hypothetical protein L916_04429 [Phytophthora nicotianae]
MDLPDASTGSRKLDEEQRAKNRLIVKRCYYKKLNTLSELRDQVTTLEAEYERLLAVHHERDAQPSSDADRDDTDANLHRAYVQLAQMKSALTKENAELKRLEAEHAMMEKQVAQLTSVHNKAVAAVRQAQEEKRTNPMIVVNSLTLEQCNSIASTAYEEVMAFRQSKTCFTTGTNMFGWRDRHKLLPDKLMFSLEKIFHGRTMEEVSQGTWQVLSHPASLMSMYPRDVKSHFHVTQRLDDNTVIYYHTLEREDSEVRARAFILVMLVNLGIADQCMLLYKSLDPKSYLRQEGDLLVRDPRGRKKVEPQKENVWMDSFIWGFFERTGENGEHCKDDFGGVIQGTELATAGWWCLEILQIAMRIEAQVIGPQALLVQ